MFFDKDVDRAAQKQRSPFTDRLAGVTAALGDQYGFHVSEALLIAGVLFNHENMRESGRDAIEAGVLAYVVDTLVNTRDHFASDVLAGAFLGSAVGHFIVNRHGEKEKGVLSKADLQLVPIRNGLAARIVY